MKLLRRELVALNPCDFRLSKSKQPRRSPFRSRKGNFKVSLLRRRRLSFSWKMLLASKFAMEKFEKFNYAKVKLNFQCVFHSFSAFRPSIHSTMVGVDSRAESQGREKHNSKKVSKSFRAKLKNLCSFKLLTGGRRSVLRLKLLLLRWLAPCFDRK